MRVYCPFQSIFVSTVDLSANLGQIQVKQTEAGKNV